MGSPAVPSRKDVPRIGRDELRRRLRDPALLLLDVLPRESWLEGHLPGAVSLPVAEIPDRAREVIGDDPRREVVVYCAKPT